MESTLSLDDKLRGSRWFVAQNSLNAVFCAFAFNSSIFVLFLNELGFDKSRIGFLLSLFPFCGLVSLVMAPTVAKLGYKRTAVIGYGSRKFVFALLLLSPWALKHYGADVTFWGIAGVLFMFAMLRAVAETGIYPWQQEFIPDHFRGKITAIVNILATLCNILTALLAGYIINRYVSYGMDRYLWPMAGAIVCGLAGAFCFCFIPGGKPQATQKIGMAYFREMIRSFSDKNYRLFLMGMAMVMLGIAGLTFIPLFLNEQIGLPAGRVIYIDIGTLMGGLISSYLWGWASDRFGSKPVMMTGPCLAMLVPVFWFLIPRHGPYVFYFAMVIAFFSGLVMMSWTIGSMRYLYVNAIPRTEITTYMAVFYAWIGLIGGIGPFLIGPLLEACRNIHGRIGVLTIDPFTPLFGLLLVFFLTSLMILKRVRADGAISVRQMFRRMFQTIIARFYSSVKRH
jgi:MFS family permease